VDELKPFPSDTLSLWFKIEQAMTGVMSLIQLNMRGIKMGIKRDFLDRDPSIFTMEHGKL